MVNGIGLRV